MEKKDAAIHEARLAAELEPLSLLINVNYADVLYHAERYDEALAYVRKTLEVEGYFLAHLLIGRIYAAKEMYAEALESIETAIRMEGRYPELVASLGYTYGMMGESKRARAILAELSANAKDYVSPIFLAEVSLAMGDYDKALEHTEEHFRMRGDLAEPLAGPRFAPLRRDYRFAQMLARVRFPDRSVLNSPAFQPTTTL
jgi:tetratricopeptide (TPR) repeat protein